MDRWTEEIEQRVGTLLARRYELIRVLGRGGMGAVFEARHKWTDARVAIKLMLRDGGLDPNAMARFLREAKAATRISHPSVVQVFDVAQDPEDGALFIVMEYLTGSTLRQRLEAERKLAPREALEVLVPITDALVAAHRVSVIHRDIKPENIFVATTPKGTVPKLIDFGISRVTDPSGDSIGLTRTGATLGTPQYMSPEQARGDKQIGPQSDVWALGVVMFEVLAGRPPFVGDNYNAVLAAILTTTPPPLREVAPEVPPALAAIVDRALERDAASRYADMTELLDALLSCSAFVDSEWHRELVARHRDAAQAVADETPAPPADPEDIAFTPTLPRSAAKAEIVEARATPDADGAKGVTPATRVDENDAAPDSSRSVVEPRAKSAPPSPATTSRSTIDASTKDTEAPAATRNTTRRRITSATIVVAALAATAVTVAFTVGSTSRPAARTVRTPIAATPPTAPGATPSAPTIPTPRAEPPAAPPLPVQAAIGPVPSPARVDTNPPAVAHAASPTEHSATTHHTARDATAHHAQEPARHAAATTDAGASAPSTHRGAMMMTYDGTQ